MRLRTKFIYSISAIISVAFGITFYRVYVFQNSLVYEQMERQAKLLTRQILQTRQWVADHKGIFLLQEPGVTANPYLENGVVRDKEGHVYLKRNPAMVTRELAEYANRSNLCRFRVTSLRLVNPENAPDNFERAGLESFQSGESEAIGIGREKDGRVLRYMIPLVIVDSCMECHRQQGYHLGDIRGGLSLTLPLDWADRKVSANMRLLLLVMGATICVAALALFALVNYGVVRRIDAITAIFGDFNDESSLPEGLLRSSDEIGELARSVDELKTSHFASRRKLKETREAMFRAEKLAALGRLSAGVAHEINNPLGGMRNCIKSLRENPEDRDMRDRYLPLLDQGLQRIETVVRQMLDFGRREPLQYRKARLDDVIRESLLLLKYRMKKVDLQLDLQAESLLPLDVEALKQVIVNIALNGLQAMPDGGVLAISSRERQGKVEMRIRDTGTGMPQEILGQIFDPFFTTKGEGQGTGLGLAVSYSLVEGMGGVLSVTSKVGEGSTFLVALPVESGRS